MIVAVTQLQLARPDDQRRRQPRLRRRQPGPDHPRHERDPGAQAERAVQARSPSSTGRRARSRRSPTRSRSAAIRTWSRSTSSRARRTTTPSPPTGRRSAPRGSSTSPTRRRRRSSPTSASRSTSRRTARRSPTTRARRASCRATRATTATSRAARTRGSSPARSSPRACACSTSATRATRARSPTSSRRTRPAGPRATRATTRCPARRSCPSAARSGTRTATPASTTSSSPAGRSRRPLGGAATGDCTGDAGFRSVSATPRGKRVRLSFTRRRAGAVKIEVFQVSQGRRVISERRVARFRGSATWNGRGPDGYYFARFTMAGQDVRRIVLRKRNGRFTRVARHYRRGDCELLRSFKLERPVFGGRQRTPLRVAFRLTRAAQVTIDDRARQARGRPLAGEPRRGPHVPARAPAVRARDLPRADHGRRRALDAHREAALTGARRPEVRPSRAQPATPPPRRDPPRRAGAGVRGARRALAAASVGARVRPQVWIPWGDGASHLAPRHGGRPDLEAARRRGHDAAGAARRRGRAAVAARRAHGRAARARRCVRARGAPGRAPRGRGGGAGDGAQPVVAAQHRARQLGGLLAASVLWAVVAHLAGAPRAVLALATPRGCCARRCGRSSASTWSGCAARRACSRRALATIGIGWLLPDALGQDGLFAASDIARKTASPGSAQLEAVPGLAVLWDAVEQFGVAALLAAVAALVPWRRAPRRCARWRWPASPTW